jgi:hypothetical protein
MTLINKNHNFEFIKNNQTCIFTIKDFFEENFYNNLKNNFPDFNKNYLIKNNHGKYSLHSRTKEYERIVFSNNILTTFHNLIFNENFMKRMYNILRYKILFSNKENLIRMLKHFRIKKFIFYKEERKHFLDFLISKIKVELEFSFMINQAKIVPHVDSIKEIFSLLLYFPTFETQINPMHTIEKEYGTTFWASKSYNYTNRHLISHEDEQTFKQKNLVFFKSPFIRNSCCGFVRNDKSWHTVEPLDIQEDYIRRSININFLLQN